MGRVSVAQICEAIWEVEDKFKVVRHQTKDIFPWPALRMSTYYRLAAHCGIFESANNPSNMLREAVLGTLTPVRNVAGDRATLTATAPNRGFDLLIITYTPDIGGRAVPFATSVAERALSEGRTVLLLSEHEDKMLEARSGFCRVAPNNLYRRMLINYAKNLPLRSFNTSLPGSEQQLWTAVGDSVSRRLSTNFSIIQSIQQLLFQSFVLRPIYQRFLDRFRPTEIAVVCHYGKSKAMWMHEAKVRGILVTDIQHGTMSKYHLGYSYPDWKSHDGAIPYFPDRILTWGGYWSESTPIPLPAENIVSIGFQKLKNSLGRAGKTADRRSGKVLVLSQTVISKPLQEWVARMALLNPSFSFVFKCHPHEAEGTVFERFKTAANVTVLKDASLYDLMMESEFVVGIFSTAIFEAIAHGCKPILLPLPGIEYMQFLIKKYDVPVLDDPEQFITAAAQARRAEIPLSYFFG